MICHCGHSPYDWSGVASQDPDSWSSVGEAGCQSLICRNELRHHYFSHIILITLFSFISLCRLAFGTPNSLVFLLPQWRHFLVSLPTSSSFPDLLMLECLGLRAWSPLHWHPLSSLLALKSTYIQTTFKCRLLAEVSVLNFRFAYPDPLGPLTLHRSNMSSFLPAPSAVSHISADGLLVFSGKEDLSHRGSSRSLTYEIRSIRKCHWLWPSEHIQGTILFSTSSATISGLKPSLAH